MNSKNLIISFLFILGTVAILPVYSAAQVVPLGQVVYNPMPFPSGTASGVPVQTNGASLVGVLLPASLTSTSMSFVVSSTSSGTYVPLYNSSGQVVYTIAQGTFVSVNPSDFYGVQFFKVVLGSNEAGARVITASMKGM